MSLYVLSSIAAALHKSVGVLASILCELPRREAEAWQLPAAVDLPVSRIQWL